MQIKSLFSHVAAFFLGALLVVGALLRAPTPDIPPLRELPDGQWLLLEKVKGFDFKTQKPLYWAIAQEYKTVPGTKIRLMDPRVQLLTFPREQVGERDTGADARLTSREITLEIKGGRGEIRVEQAKNSI